MFIELEKYKIINKIIKKILIEHIIKKKNTKHQLISNCKIKNE